MILLEYHNPIIYEVIKEKFEAEKPESTDTTICDFDGVSYHLSTPQSKSILQLSIRMKCFPELLNYGVMELLQREYGQYLVSAEQGYDVSLAFNVETLSPSDKDDILRRAPLLKRNILAAPFETAFQLSSAKQSSDLMVLNYREEEAIYIRAAEDRVTVIFSTTFKEVGDQIFAKVFLQEFVDARRQYQNAPQVLYSSRDPPLELRGVPGVREGDNIGYVTFVLFPRHYTPAALSETISRIQIFRDYLHYHIKCSKAYMHSRMRARVESLLKVLNRAKPEDKGGEKKTASGRTFVRR
ncbi:Arp2/3 complex, 34 kd subunit p34-Arc-domain-containing protein [Paraphysoderma sedebokerense]|nr:Arp2/3 complex, 34 kd subunit p34-Arc-domain-containing protein [Paraphysoderma sedebokerense]KAI9138597.1 Arp2/3 complex, 34 kd subunit p34-Arc-domain-containing protein [Paraphysoderma sedebokerense]